MDALIGLAGLGSAIFGLFLFVMAVFIPLVVFLMYGELRRIRKAAEEMEYRFKYLNLDYMPFVTERLQEISVSVNEKSD